MHQKVLCISCKKLTLFKFGKYTLISLKSFLLNPVLNCYAEIVTNSNGIPCSFAKFSNSPSRAIILFNFLCCTFSYQGKKSNFNFCSLKYRNASSFIIGSISAIFNPFSMKVNLSSNCFKASLLITSCSNKILYSDSDFQKLFFLEKYLWRRK